MTDASADMSSSFNVGYWHEWSCSVPGFVSVLATALANAGWTRAEEGYDTMSPEGYPDIYFSLENLYSASLIRQDGGTTSDQFTYLQARLREGYDGGTHLPDTSENGGRSRFRMFRDNDYTADDGVTYDIKGWITSTCCLLWIHSEAVSGGDKRQIIFCGEMDRIGEGAKTVMLLVSEWVSETGTRSIDQTNSNPPLETHFIHCLGDGHCYIPMSHGFGVSSLDNKIRPQVVVAWRYTGSGAQQQYNLAWQIPSDVLRAVRWPGIEDDLDTFLDGSETFIRLERPSFSYEGGVYLIKDNYNASEDAGYWWFRKG